MIQFETQHYIFYLAEGSYAESRIEQLAAEQEACYAHMSRVIGYTLPYKINYHLCETPEEVGKALGETEPCNGFAQMPDIIYAVYNEKIQCMGFHEDAHLLSNALNRPNFTFLREGVAMYFDRYWWGISNLDWVLYYRSKQLLPKLTDLLENDFFESLDCGLTYPLVGAFVDYLMITYGKEYFWDFWKMTTDNIETSCREVFGQTVQELEKDFLDYLNLFSLSPELKRVMEGLL